MTIEKIKKERDQIFSDVLSNIIPKRVPIHVNMSMYAIAQYAKIDPKRCYWDYSLLENAIYELCDMIPTDIAVPAGNFFHPAKSQALNSICTVMADNGYVQHPNTHMLEPEDYDELIADPYKFIVEKAVPRVNPALDFSKNPDKANAALHRAIEYDKAIGAINRNLFSKVTQKYGYSGFGRGGGGYASLDILTDELRSFSLMLTDIRRYRSKVKDAVEAISPFNFFHSMPDMKTYTRDAFNLYAFHMAPYMREKDFAELWWEPFKREANDFAAMGVRVYGFLEQDWTRYIDYLEELPANSYYLIEYGDLKQFKERLGKKFILSGGYPLSNLTQMSKQQCIDSTKEYLDLMMPGGQLVFSFDKGILTMADVNMENLIAVLETVRDYGVYSNAGESCGIPFNQADYKKSDMPEFKSEAYMSWDKYKEEFPNTPDDAKETVECIEKSVLNFYYSLLM